jgi:hypothetical protein
MVETVIYRGETSSDDDRKSVPRNSLKEPFPGRFLSSRAAQNRFNPICQESQMHSSLTAVVLCIFAPATAAQCVAAAPQGRDVRMGVETIKTATIAPTSTAPVRQGGKLIKTAAAGTRDVSAGPREAAPSVRDKVGSVKSDDEHPPRSGTAMLLAALALMSGIALRRYGANPQ